MKKYLLPILAAVLIVVAAVVIFAVPKGNTRTAESLSSDAPGYVRRTGDGNVIISADDLDQGRLTVLKYSEDSRIELIATLDAEGNVRAALGTCQSCMGSPGAYYTQNGELLQCNNCGLTFPMSVIGVSGAGCHPIMIDEAAISRGADGLVIDDAAISPYEPLFATVAAH